MAFRHRWRVTGGGQNTSTWETSPPPSGRPTSIPGPSSTTTRTASRRPTKPEFRFANVAVRFRDGSLENLLVTDFNGTANFNETFPLFNWYVVETDVTRYKNTGTHVVYDAGGPADGSACLRHSRLSAVRNLHDRQVPGEHRGNRLRADQPARAGRGLLRRCGLHGQVDSEWSSDQRSAQRLHDATQPAVTTCSTQLSTGRIDPPWVAESKAGRASPARTTSSSSARSPMRRARTAASRATSSMPRPVRLTTRRCWCRRSGSRWFRTSPSTSTRKVSRRTA